MALRTGNGSGGLFMPVAMAGGLPDAHGSGRCAYSGSTRAVGAWIASGGAVAGARVPRGAKMRCNRRNVPTGRRCGTRVEPCK